MARLKPPNPAISFGETIEDTIVPDNVVRMWSTLRGVRSNLDAMYGAGEWGDEEVRRYVAQREWERKLAWEAAGKAGVQVATPVAPKAKRAKTKAKKAKAKVLPSPPPKLPEADETEIDEAVERIMSGFPDLTEANRPMVRQREYYNRILPSLAAAILYDLEKGDSSQVRQKQQMMIDIQKEARQIEKDLGLDAGTLRSGGIEDLRGEIITVMDRAKALLDKHAMRITCPACRASRQERNINLGFILYHFRQDGPFHWFCRCPHPECGQAIHIYGGPGQETVIENGPRTLGPLKG